MFAEPEIPAATEDAPLAHYRPVVLAPRHDGWTAARQRRFLVALAETGSISLASAEAGISARSAYRLRARPEATAFARGWDQALKLATIRLTTLAFERATRGTVREIWKDDHLVGSTRTPNDKLLMFLLQHLLPAGKAGDRWAGMQAMLASAGTAFPASLDALEDNPAELLPVQRGDFFDAPPGHPDEDW